jgi:uncharacterized protein YdiU (UPF0061 family)
VETAAVLVRVAPSLIRFGSFELFHHRGEEHRVRTLADFVIAEVLVVVPLFRSPY